MTEPGRLISVSKSTLGSVLAADATSGDGFVVVNDTSDFDEQGGTLQLGGSTYDYTAADPETGVLTLDDTLNADADEGDRVDVWDTGLDQVAEEGRALVALPGGLANDEPIDADIGHSLMAFLDEGIRDPGTEEAVEMSLRGGSWVVTDVPGKRSLVKPSARPIYLDWSANVSGDVSLPADTATDVNSAALTPGSWMVTAGVTMTAAAATPVAVWLQIDDPLNGSITGATSGQLTVDADGAHITLCGVAFMTSPGLVIVKANPDLDAGVVGATPRGSHGNASGVVAVRIAEPD